MIKLAYHFKCDALGCSVESKDNIGDVNHRMLIAELPIPRGWHYLDHRIICDAHSVVIDKKWIDATAFPTPISPVPIEESQSWADAVHTESVAAARLQAAAQAKKANKTKKKK